jgi:hypothetical protein
MNNENAAAERVRRVENGEPVEAVYAEQLEAKGFGGLDSVAYSLCDDDRALLARLFIAERDETNDLRAQLAAAQKTIEANKRAMGEAKAAIAMLVRYDPDDDGWMCIHENGDWIEWERVNDALATLTAAIAAGDEGFTTQKDEI